ncbi:sensor histidine kinase [Rheinheimera sp. MMS21-TC3]|uniref:sensor histidine kinase n=1 Tax=Rheinheimera sp. MMS21-TC3 TaxID=3072790 RepID=UPI0028C4AC76|nr:ATP-binding protein [Rheinheimera sp. MMS21-TC3]WNO61800.1 ATP-binding protein [Rheinheimera sp. MMS21-TC3]
MTMTNAFAVSSLYTATLDSSAANVSALPAYIRGKEPVETAQDQQAEVLLQALPAAVILLNQRGYVYQANAAAIDLLGQPLIGQRWLDVITRSFSPRSDDGLEVSLKDGRRVKLAISALAPSSDHGQPGQLIMLTDLTETRALQSRLSHMQRLSSLGKMMASLAHQIRTPLSAAMLYAQNLANPRITMQTQQQFQHKLQSRLLDLEQQVNDMLLFARSDSSQAVAAFSVEDLVSAIQASADAILLAANASLKLTNTAPNANLIGNMNALSGAILNLIQNSLQAIPEQAEISLTISKSQHQAEHIVIAVADNGPGVASSIQSQLFEPFITSKSSGTGLGLAVVQAVAHSHHGVVSYKPSKSGGACFELTLPVQHTTDNNADACLDKNKAEA